MYRIRPSVAHGGIAKTKLNDEIQASFSPLNPRVEYNPSQQAWDPLAVENEPAQDFVESFRTTCGQGDPTSKQSIAVRIHVANRSMQDRAFCNNDGDFLILPQQSRLDIQTELGHLMVGPGEVVVIQSGLRFKVRLPDGPSRGYIHLVFGAHYELPELGPIGSNGMALPRDFESPLANFDIDFESEWEIIYKLVGSLHSCQQQHTYRDVVAWHGNYAPYKYAIEKFIDMANVEVDQADPTIYCVLTARLVIPGVSLTDFLVFTPKTIPTHNAFRPPYYHRSMSTEVMGLVYGTYGGSSHALDPGGLSYEASYMPHGETYVTWKSATIMELQPIRLCVNTLAFMFHISVPLLLTDWAMKNPGLHPADVKQWSTVKGHFLDYLDNVNDSPAKAGLPCLGDDQRHIEQVGKVNGVNGVNGR